MRNIRFTWLASAAMMTLAWSSSSKAKEVLLQHDQLSDGSEAAAVCGFAVGEKFAVKFTPPAYPAKLLNVQVMLAAVPLSQSGCNQGTEAQDIKMPLTIYHLTGPQLPGTSLKSFENFMYSSGTNLNELNVTSFDVNIDSGSFLIVYTLDDTRASPVHDNSKAAHNDVNFIYGDLGLGPSWYSFTDLASYGQAPKGDWVVRVKVNVPDGTGGTGGAGGSGGSGGGAAGSGGGAAGSGGGAAGSDGGAAGSSGGAAGSGAAGSGGSGGSTAGSAGSGGSGGGAAGANPSTCVRDTDCQGGERCDQASGTCVRVVCDNDSDCAGGFVCPDHVCRKLCTAVSDCRGGEDCRDMDGVSVCAPPAQTESNVDDGGCAISPSSGASSNAWLIGLGIVGLWLGSRRRKQRK